MFLQAGHREDWKALRKGRIALVHRPERIFDAVLIRWPHPGDTAWVTDWGAFWAHQVIVHEFTSPLRNANG